MSTNFDLDTCRECDVFPGCAQSGQNGPVRILLSDRSTLRLPLWLDHLANSRHLLPRGTEFPLLIGGDARVRYLFRSQLLQ